MDTTNFEKIFEGRFILKWNDWAMYALSMIESDSLVKPDKIPDSIKLKELLAVVFVCLFVHLLWCLIIVVEIGTWYAK